MPDALPRHSVSVTAVVVRPADGRVLAIRGRRDELWVPPGGVLELDELPQDGVVREVLEETGVTVRPQRLTGVYKNMSLGVVSLAFLCHPTDDKPTTTEEATAVEWLTLDEVKHRMVEARAIRVLDAHRDDGPFVRAHNGTRLIVQD